MSISAIVFACTGLTFARGMFFTAAGCGIVSFLVLVFGFVISDFSVQNVFFNSSTLKPLIYKISAAWASHEGSILFWLSLLNLVCIVYVYIISTQQIAKIQLRILSFIIFLFSSFIYFTSNPFAALTITPAEGLGLNPVLQDAALAIHPPILYLGYVSYVVLFTNAIIILLKKNNEILRAELLEISKIFSSFGMLTLTLGIGIGGWWAYRELGWGGFWYFDPVENISLMPWLVGIALHHSLQLSLNHNKAFNWTLSLSIIAFLLTILGTFLVRSGLLTSIHSFNSSRERALYLFIIFLLIAIPSLCLLIIKNRTHDFARFNFKERGIIAGNILWSLNMVIILAATLYPLIYSYLFAESVSLDLNFFSLVFLPVIILITFVAGTFSGPILSNNTLVIAIISLCLTIISCYVIRHSNMSALAFLGAVYLIFQTTYMFIVKSDFLRRKLPPSTNSMILGHLGFGLLALSITLNTILQKEFEFVGTVDESRILNQFEVSLKGIKFADGSNYYRQIAEFWIADQSNNKVTILKPENRYYKIEKTLSQESDIFSYLTHDLYAVMNRIDDNVVHAKIYYRPFISFIWLSIFVMSSGFAIGLLGRAGQFKNRKAS